MLVMKTGKGNITEKVKLSNQLIIRTLGEKETYKYWGILEANTIKLYGMKEKIKKEYLRRTRKLLKINSIAGSLSKG